MWQIWLLIAGFFLILEIITVGFLVFWFAISALITMVLSFFIESLSIQITVFVVVSTILLFATKPFVEKITRKDSVVKTNAYSIEGKIGKVISPIEPMEGTGQIKVNGEVWSAKSYDGAYIEKDTEIIIERIDGVKVIVKPLKETVKK